MKDKKGYTTVTTTYIPEYVGKYSIGELKELSFCFSHKPCWVHRFFMNLLLGWKWEDL